MDVHHTERAARRTTVVYARSPGPASLAGGCAGKVGCSCRRLGIVDRRELCGFGYRYATAADGSPFLALRFARTGLPDRPPRPPSELTLPAHEPLVTWWHPADRVGQSPLPRRSKHA